MTLGNYNGEKRFEKGLKIYNPLLKETYTIESVSLRPKTESDGGANYTMAVDPPTYTRKDRETGKQITVTKQNIEINHRVLITMPWQIIIKN